MKRQTARKGGFIVTAELLLISTILVIGLVVGLTLVRNAVVAELEDTAEAIGAIDQSYFVTGTEDAFAGTAGTDGSIFTDDYDPLAGQYGGDNSWWDEPNANTLVYGTLNSSPDNYEAMDPVGP